MMRLKALVRVSFMQLVSGFKTPSARRSGKTTSSYGSLAFLGFILLYISVMYSGMFTEALREAGRPELIFLLMSISSAAMLLLLFAFSAGAALFGGRDSEMLLALPVSTFEIMLSKTLALFLENLFACYLLMLPATVIYMTGAGEASLLLLIMVIITTPLLALISSSLTMLVGAAVTWLGSKTKGNKLAANIFYLVFFAAVLYFSFNLNSLLPNLAQQAGALMESPPWYFLPFVLFSRAVFGDFAAFGLLLLGSLAVFALLTCLFGRGYKSITSAMRSAKTRSDFKLSSVRSSSQMTALIRREGQRLYSTPIYLFNTCFGLLILLGLSVYATIERAQLAAFLSEAFGAGSGLSAALVAGGVCLLIGTVCTSSVSLSLERNTLWILKESPLEAEEIFFSKALFNMTLCLPVALISCLSLGLALSLSALEILLCFLLAAAVNAMVSFFGVLINLKFPKLDAYNDVIIVKQSMAAVIPIFGSMFIIGAVTALYLTLLSRFLSFPAFALLCILLLASLSYLAVVLLRTWGRRVLARL
ncbi:MAG: hypothetical protein Q4B42_00190 [Oscillospiraceae bacterium]|nr:hypothetical protein [Oscillospiraceae bacterium]